MSSYRPAIEDPFNAFYRDMEAYLPGAAPPIGQRSSERTPLRLRTSQQTCIVGTASGPQINLPLAEGDGMPVGLSLLGARGSDEMLLAFARQIGSETGPLIFAKAIICRGAAKTEILPSASASEVALGLRRTSAEPSTQRGINHDHHHIRFS